MLQPEKRHKEEGQTNGTFHSLLQVGYHREIIGQTCVGFEEAFTDVVLADPMYAGSQPKGT